MNELPLYPTEDIIWDENIVPTEYFSGEGIMFYSFFNIFYYVLDEQDTFVISMIQTILRFIEKEDNLILKFYIMCTKLS